MRNGRCRLHGGLSTGPRTPEGLERSRRARWKHGGYSVEARSRHLRLKAECLAFNLAAAAHQALVFSGMRQILRAQRKELRNLKRRRRRIVWVRHDS
jgi:hypothetical protein